MRADWMIYHWHFFLAWWDPWICEVSWRTEGSCVVPSVSMILCSKRIHLTIFSALLKFVTIALFSNRHFSVMIPKVHSTFLLACNNLQLKTFSSHDINFLVKGFIKYVFRGYALSPRMTKDISVPLPSKLAGFGRVDSRSSKKWYKVEPENVPPSICLPKTCVSIEMNLRSEYAAPCNTTEEKYL